MNASSNTKFAIGVTVSAVIVFGAAFIPWGGNASPIVKSFPTSRDWERPASGGPPVLHITFPMTITGWNGYLSVGALKLPNWLVVLAAGAVTALSWLKAFSIWDAPAIVPLALAAYGLFHTGLVYVLLAISHTEEGGALLTAVAFIAILVLLVVQQVERDAMEQHEKRKRIYQIVSVLFCLLGLGFSIASPVTGNLVLLPAGMMLLSVGMMFLVLAQQSGKSPPENE